MSSDNQLKSKTLDLGILKCDSLDSGLQTEFGDYPAMFNNLLAGDSFPISVHAYDLPSMQFPETLEECDFWLFTGSAWSVNEKSDWITRAHELARSLHANQCLTIGICFGHQLIMNALGGTVKKADAGWGVGIHTMNVEYCRSWMVPIRDSVSLIVSHQDQVDKLPEEATWLAGHDFCPYDLCQIGHHVITLQGHPEFSRGLSRALMAKHRTSIGEHKYQEGLRSLAYPIDSDTVTNWLSNFISAHFAQTREATCKKLI